MLRVIAAGRRKVRERERCDAEDKSGCPVENRKGQSARSIFLMDLQRRFSGRKESE